MQLDDLLIVLIVGEEGEVPAMDEVDTRLASEAERTPAVHLNYLAD